MERSPIYQTRSTRVLYYRRSPKGIIKYVLAAVLLLLLGTLLGHGLPWAQLADASRPAGDTAGSIHQAVIDRLAAVTTAAPPSEHGTTLPVAGGASNSSAAVTITPTAASSDRVVAAVTVPAPHQQWQVAQTGGLGLCLRVNHDLNDRPVRVLPDGTLVTALEPDVVVAGHIWRHVSVADGVQGWVVGDYLTPAQ